MAPQEESSSKKKTAKRSNSGSRSATSGPFEVKLNSLSAARQARRQSAAPLFESSVIIPRHPGAPDSDDDFELSVPSLEPPVRKYECPNYETCLDLAASLNWSSFTCAGCDGTVDQALYWRAHQSQRHDSVARALCELPPITLMTGVRGDCSQDVLGSVAPCGSSVHSTHPADNEDDLKARSGTTNCAESPVDSGALNPVDADRDGIVDDD